MCLESSSRYQLVFWEGKAVKKALLLLTVLVFYLPVVAFSANGIPFKDIKSQLNDIRGQLSVMQIQIEHLIPGVANLVLRERVGLVYGNNDAVVACCEENEAVISGGYLMEGSPEVLNLWPYANFPRSDLKCWVVQAKNYGTDIQQVWVYAICAQK